MLKNYLKIAFRNLVRHKTYSIINIFGLSFGLACAVLILLFVQDELRFDNFHEKKDRLFRVIEIEKKPSGEERMSAYQPAPLAQALVEEFAEIESAAMLLNERNPLSYGELSAVHKATYTHPGFLKMFSFPLLKGSAEDALTDPNSIVITQEIAEKFFGDEEPVGKNIEVSHWQGKRMHVVTGVIQPAPSNSSIQFEAILPITSYPTYEQRLTRWSSFNGSVYVQLTKTADVSALESKFSPFIQKYWGDMIERARSRGRMTEAEDAMRIAFQPITDIHLGAVSFSEEPVSNPMYAWILGGIATLILIIACINFVTLAIGRSSTRALEVGVRKALGAGRFQIKKQFWGEAVLLTGFSAVLGVVLAEYFLPLFNKLSNKSLEFDLLINGPGVLGLIGVVLFVSLLAGSYPAAWLSRFRPVEVFKGKSGTGGKNRLTRSLIVFQFGLSIFLIVCAIFMQAQQNFMMTRSLGYNADLVLGMRSFAGSPEESVSRLERLRAELLRTQNIEKVSGVSSSFNRGWSVNGFEHKGEQKSAFVYKIDHDFIDLLDIELAEGRNFSRELATDMDDAIIVNEAFVKEFGWQENAVGQRLEGWNKKQNPLGPVVVGVVKDYHFLSMHQEIKPMMLMLEPEWSLGDYLIRFSGKDVPGTIESIRKVWLRVAPNTPFDFAFIDEDVERQYRSESRWASIINASSSIAVLLACLGLFGLVTLSVNRRTKEIGVRKVLGASYRQIAALVTHEFVLLVIVANLVAWPAAWFVMNKWLQNFAYRIDLEWWAFGLAGGLALIIALATISAQAFRAASSNPVDALKYE